MKPPPRKRTKRDYGLKEEAPYSSRVLCNWPKVEQKKLLAALNNLSTSRFTNPTTSESTNQSTSHSTNLCASLGPPPDLDSEQLRKELDTRSTEEINAVLESVKKKIIVFAQNKLKTERSSERKGQKPIDMWTQVASLVTGEAEVPLSAAFSQMFLVTSTEPCTVSNSFPALSHSPATALNKGNTPVSNTSVPPPSPAMASTVNKIPPSQQHKPGNTPKRLTATGTSSQSTENGRLLSFNPDEVVSFERIYQYFSVLQKPHERCKLTPMESAIVLDLLMSLPEEIMLLDCNKLVKHLTQMYQYLYFPANSKLAKDFLKDLQSQQLPGEPEPKENSELLSNLSQMNCTLYSPLNPFLIPVSLLERKAPTEANQT